MALNDFCINGLVAAHWSIVFWSVAPVAGFLLSCWFGYRTDREAGLAIERGEAWRIGLHWSSIFVAALAAGTILGTNHLDVSVGGPLMLLISGLVYFLGGVHLDRRFLLPGLAAMFGSAALYHLGPYSQTIVGLVIAAALVATRFGSRKRRPPPMPPAKPDGRVNGLARLDKLLEHRSRLGAACSLPGRRQLRFAACATAGGNRRQPGAHLRSWKRLGTLKCVKEFQDRKPVSWYTLTAKGRQSLKAHLDAMQAVIRDSRI